MMFVALWLLSKLLNDIERCEYLIMWNLITAPICLRYILIWNHKISSSNTRYTNLCNSLTISFNEYCIDYSFLICYNFGRHWIMIYLKRKLHIKYNECTKKKMTDIYHTLIVRWVAFVGNLKLDHTRVDEYE